MLPSDDWLFREAEMSYLECEPDERKCKYCNDTECKYYDLRFGDNDYDKNI